MTNFEVEITVFSETEESLKISAGHQEYGDFDGSSLWVDDESAGIEPEELMDRVHSAIEFNIEEYPDFHEDCFDLSSSIKINSPAIIQLNKLLTNDESYLLEYFNLDSNNIFDDPDHISDLYDDPVMGEVVREIKSKIDYFANKIKNFYSKNKVVKASVRFITEDKEPKNIIREVYGYSEGNAIIDSASSHDYSRLKHIFPNCEDDSLQRLTDFVNCIETDYEKCIFIQSIDESGKTKIDYLFDKPKHNKPDHDYPVTITINNGYLIETINHFYHKKIFKYSFGNIGAVEVKNDQLLVCVDDIGISVNDNTTPLDYFCLYMVEQIDTLDSAAEEEYYSLTPAEERARDFFNDIIRILSGYYDLFEITTKSSSVIVKKENITTLQITYNGSDKSLTVRSKDINNNLHINDPVLDNQPLMDCVDSLSKDELNAFTYVARSLLHFSDLYIDEKYINEIRQFLYHSLNNISVEEVNSIKQQAKENVAAKSVLDKPKKINAMGKIFVSTYLNEEEENEVGQITSKHGGIYIDRIDKYSDYLIVKKENDFSFSITNKVEEAIAKKEKGEDIQIIPFNLFCDLENESKIDGTINELFKEYENYYSYPENISVAKSEFFLLNDKSQSYIEAKKIIKKKKGKITERLKKNIYLIVPKSIDYVSYEIIKAIKMKDNQINITIVNDEWILELAREKKLN